MALKYMLGFDLYPGNVDAGGYIVNGAGIEKTHYAPDFRVVSTAVASTPTLNNQIGVSGQAAHKMSPGSVYERNAFVIKRMGNQNTNAYLRNITPLTAPAEGGMVCTAFTYKVLPGINTSNNEVPLFSIYSGAAGAALVMLKIRSSTTDTAIQLSFFNNPAIPVTKYPYLVAGREYHIEVRMIRRVGAPSGTYDFQLRIDGDLIDSAAITDTRFNTSGICFFYGVNILNAQVNIASLYSDIIIADSNAGIFDKGIGPQLILPSKMASVTPGAWEKEGNATATDTLTDFNDTTYYASPVDAGAMSVKVAGVNTPYKTLASEVVIRASRDRDAGRILTAEMRNADGSASLTPPSNIATANGYNPYLLARLEGIAEADIRTPTVRLNATVP
ncbi:hypothetical protein [Stenotrophomonas sp. GD03657]|uniref:hypothetical protein n=1 Tax=Stenotrophomonas sp. GD03657 TaxID=2975363 RepID=UPI00244CEA1F|nr:hypothetical protein [Stenotrophomonas sp. GD03657]MDH2154114.1 hypothetical protein [Stenotrophomonas sp. GD03657]